MVQGGFLRGEGKKWLQMALEHSISSHYSKVYRLSELRASGEQVVSRNAAAAWCSAPICDRRREDGTRNLQSPTLRHCLCDSGSACDRDCLNISNLKQRRPTLLGSVFTEPFMPMQTSHALDIEFYQQNVSITSPWKKGDTRLKPISRGPKHCTRRLPFHSLWESRFQKSYIKFFFFNPAIQGLRFQLHFTLNRLVFPAV